MRARVIISKEYSTLGAALTMRFLLLSACLAVTRAENVAMTSSVTFVDLPDPLPESDHTNDDANAADDENVTGFPPVDDLTDGARGWRAGFAAAACAVALASSPSHLSPLDTSA